MNPAINFLPSLLLQGQDSFIRKKNRGILIFLSLRYPLSTTFLEVSGKNRKKKVWFFFLIPSVQIQQIIVANS